MKPVSTAFVLHVMQVAGAEVLVAEIIRRLRGRIDPVVLCLDGVGQLGDVMLREGVPVVALGRRLGFDWIVVHRLACELRLRRVEVVHAHQYTPFFYAALAKVWNRGGCHLMFTEHGRHYPDVVSRRRRLANRLLLARVADEVSGVCGFSVRSLAEKDGFAGRPMEVIENGIDLERYTIGQDKGRAREAAGLAPDRRLIICVARFHPVKDHRMLLSAFAIVAARRPDVDLLLIGDGPLRPELVRQAEELGISARTRFLGIRSDVPALLRAAEVFTLTSVSEAASITLLEAMASGLPVVVTDVGGNPDIVRTGVDGLVVPRGDHQAAAAAFDRLLGDPTLAEAMGREGRRRVEERFRLDDTIQKYLTRYEAAAARRRGRLTPGVNR